MVEANWTVFSRIKDIAHEVVDPTVVQKVDSMLSAAFERIADMLSTATPAELRIAMMSAKEALEVIERAADVDEDSPSFTAGRLASAVDLLGYASYQTADDQVVALVQKQPYADILAILAQESLRNVDLAARLGKDEARTSKWLAELREAGGITSHKRGRETYNAVTPIGRLVVEKGREDARSVPIETCHIHDLAAYRRSPYDLKHIPTPEGTTPDEVPMLSAVS